MKFIAIFLFFIGLQSRAETVDCKGVVYNKPVYISTNPASPYSQFVRRECIGAGLPIVALDGDFYFVYGVDTKWDGRRPCDIAGSMWELQTAGRNDDGRNLEFQLLFCRKSEKCRATRALRIDKASGQASFFNILENGKWLLVSQVLNCSLKN